MVERLPPKQRVRGPIPRTGAKITELPSYLVPIPAPARTLAWDSLGCYVTINNVECGPYTTAEEALADLNTFDL